MKQRGKYKIRQWLKAAVACSVILTLVLTQEVLVMAKEAIEKTGQALEAQREKQAQEEYLRKNAVTGNGSLPDSDGSQTGAGTGNGDAAPEENQTPDKEGPPSDTPESEDESQNSSEAPESSGVSDGAGTETEGLREDRYPQETPLTLPELPSEAPDEFEKLYGEPVEINEYGRLYRMDAENYKLILTPDPEVYRNEDGQLKEIDNTLVAEEKTLPGGLFRKAAKVTGYTNKAGETDIEFPEEVTEDSGIRFTNPDGKTLELHPEEGEYDRPAVLENAILYNDVFDQIDIQYTVFGKQIKEDIILREPGTKDTFTYWFPRETYTAKLQNNIVLIYDKEDKDEPLFSLSAPVMIDASGTVSEAVTLTLKEEGDRYVITVSAQKEWLEDPDRNYPVKIDPTIQIPSANLGVVTTSSEKGIYSQAAYGYVGYVDSQVTGIPKSNLGRTRMFFRINYKFKDLIPEEAVVTSATLNTYEYSAYKSTATFACYRLKEAWSTGTITWDNSVGIGREIAGQDATRPAQKGWQRFDIRQSVNDWINGLAPQHGLMVMATNESTRGAAFYTPASSSSTHPLFKPEYKPYIEINWNYPNPVPVDYSLDDTTISLRTMIDCDMGGKLQFMGIFADGLATPGSQVCYALSDPEKGYTAAVAAGYTKKYPSTKDFESAFPATTTRYRDKQGNWQTLFPFTDPSINALYHLKASAKKDGKTGKEKTSDPFLVYQVTQFDTMPKIAAYYGVPLSQIVFDNRMQDMLLVENNTIFIRNPKKNADKPYNPPPLTDADKEKIDKQLMGRGLHCQFGFEPVNLNTGNFTFEATDASMPDYGGTFDITRAYNSKGAAYSSSFGRGWQFTWGEYLSQKQDGTLIYTRGDGSALYFSAEQDGNYVCPEGYDLTLKRIKVAEKKYEFTDGKPEIYPVYEYEITDTDQRIRRFDCFGTLKSLTDEKGNQTAFTYDQNYNLKSVRAGGRTCLIACTEDGKIEKITLPNGGVLSYAYDADGNLVRYTDADGASIRYEYDEKHRMTAWYDGNGTRIIQNIYDDEGRVTSQKDGNGWDAAFTYGEHQTVTVDGNGHQTIYQYDERYRTKKIIYPDGTEETMTYDGNRLASQTDALGHKTSYEYDADGNLTKEIRFDGASKSYTYDQSRHRLQETDYDGARTSYSYDREGNLLKVEKEGSLIAQYTYDGQGRTLTHTDGNGHTTTYTWQGTELAAVTDAAGVKTTMSYNPMGQLVQVTDGNGHTTTCTYSLSGALTSETDGSGCRISYTYDKAGQIHSETDGNGHTTSYTYDGMGNMTGAADETGRTMTFAYDGNGNCIRETDADGAVTQKAYNSRNQLIQETDAEGGVTSYTYDALDHLLSETDANRHTSTYTYDYASGEIASETDPEGSSISYTYDLAGNLIETTYADGSQETDTYDRLGRRTEHRDACGLRTIYTYDNAGNMLTETEGGFQTSYTYDKMNRLVKTVYANGGTETAAYDAIGNVIRETTPLGETVTYTYDGANRLLSETDAEGYITSYTYDGNGNVTDTVDGNGGRTHVDYNAFDEPEKVTDAMGSVTVYTYTPGEQISATTDPLGNQRTYTYDRLGRIIRSADENGNATVLTYDANGNTRTITAPDGGRVTYDYNGKDQVIREEDSAGLVTKYEYDKNGLVTHIWDNAGTDIRRTYDVSGSLLSETDSLNRKTEYTYDIYGNLTGITEPDGNRTAYTYDEMGNVFTMTDPEGKVTTYTYDLKNQLIETEDDASRKYQYTYDGAGNLLSETDPLGNRTAYTYDGAGNLTETTDPAGNQEILIYDALSRVIGQKDKNGSLTTLYYDPLGNLIKTISPEQGIEYFTYDPAGNLLSYTDAEGNETAYAYDSGNRITKKTMPTGGAFRYTYDTRGALTSRTEPEGEKTAYTYDLLGQMTGQKLADGAVYTYAYDPLGRITKEGGPEGQKKEYVYDVSGNLVKETDQSGRMVTYRYDRMHRLLETENALGQKTAYTYDRQGNLTGTVTPMGHKTTYAYDELDRIRQMTDPSGKVTELTYDALGNVTDQTENGSRQTSYTYDAEGNQISETNALGQKTVYTYDAMNRLTREISAGGRKTRYTYNKNSDLTAITDRNGHTTRFEYDGNGNLTRLSDAAGRQTAYGYDKNNRLTEAVTGNGAEETTVTYTYDGVGNLASQTDGNGNTTTWEYDRLGNITKEKDALGQVEAYEYDKEARLSKVIRPDGNTITYDYNRLDQLLQAAYSKEEEGEVLYGYDRDGRRVSMSDLTGTSTYTYDAMNRVTGVRSGDGNILRYEYDEFGNLSCLTYPDGSHVRYTYDDLDRLQKVTDREGKETVYTYDEDGNLTKVERANGTQAKLTYDAAGQVLSVSNYDKKGKIVSRYQYTYDFGGNIVTEQITQEGETTTWQYSYNSRGELAEAAASGAREETVHYAYDQAGNQVRIVRSREYAEETVRTVIENSYNAGNQLMERRDQMEGTTEYEYDVSGNLVRELGPDERIRTYEYDTENRLRAVTENGRLLQSALYDGDDNRVFVANRKVVTESKKNSRTTDSAGEQLTEDDAGEDADDREASSGAGKNRDIRQSRDGDFWYGFFQNLSQGFALTDHAVSDALHRFWDGLAKWFHVHLLGDRPDPDGIVRSPVKELPEPEELTQPGESGEPETIYSQTLIPYGVSEKERDTYELTYYINDMNRAYTETLMEYDPDDGTLGRTYEYGMERLGYRDEETGEFYAYAYDGRGNVANLTGEVGESVVSYMYDIYGTAEEGDVKEGGTGSSAEDALRNPYLYRGEYTDYLTGNQYLRARYYRPATGNFLTRDPYQGDPREPASLNRYTYAGNDPINLEDPSGHGWLKKKVQQAKAAVKKTASKAKKAVKSAAKTVKKTAKKVVKKTKTVVKKAKKTVKKVVKKTAKKVKSSKLYRKAKKTAAKIKKKVCTTAKRIKKATVSFVKNVDWKKVGRTTLSALEVVGSIAVGAVAVGTVATLVGAGAAVVAGIGIVANAAYSGYINQKNGENFFDGMFVGALNTSVSVFTSTIMGVNLPQNHIGDVGKMVINASVNYMGGTGSSLLLDVVNGDRPDLNKAFVNGAEQGTIAGVLSILPEKMTGGVTTKGQGLSAFAGISQQVFAAGGLNKDKEALEKSNND